jgi:hypothetical protein
MELLRIRRQRVPPSSLAAALNLEAACSADSYPVFNTSQHPKRRNLRRI